MQGFDDAMLMETPALRGVSWKNTVSLFTEFNQAHYTPLSLLSLALNYELGGLEPYGYHAGNVILHALAAALAYLFLAGVLPTSRAAVLAAVLFAVHPMQLESVALAIQRKTVLSGAFFFLTLLLYQRWMRERRPALYLGCLLAFAAAAASKATVMPVPLVLVLYDVVFVGGPYRWREKLPFVVVAAAAGLAALAAHAAVGAKYGPYGGSWLTHFPVVSRVLLDYPIAILLPLDLAPMYYYASAEIVGSFTSYLALLVLVAAASAVIASAWRHPWLFFCAAWFALLLLPESNLIPISYLRADRFAYLPILGATTAAALLWETAMQRWHGSPRLLAGALAVLAVGAYASRTRAMIPVWKDEVTAWRRVVERAPEIAMAHQRYAAAQAGAGDLPGAERSYRRAAALRPDWEDPHLALAHLYARHGLIEPARAEVARFQQLAPGDPRIAAVQKWLEERP